MLKRYIVKAPLTTKVGPIEPIGDSNISHFGELLWQKAKLPASDAQRQIGNITGGLRLTQAGWKVSGSFIDQTTYFRNIVFGHLNWHQWKAKPYSEKAEANFYIDILGKIYGIHKLTISHKPSGEAGQHNYTTILHWGDLTETIRQLNLVGRTFNLYAPPYNETEPFVIKIT